MRRVWKQVDDASGAQRKALLIDQHGRVAQAFIAETLDDNGIVIDIGRAHDALKAVVAMLNYRNLDEVPEFKGRNTTTEFLTKYIFDQLAKGARAGEFGRAGRELKAIRVTLSESHVARAWYEADLW